jgi:alkylation response protein AidB-like acyl-CoA dehydrogenase
MWASNSSGWEDQGADLQCVVCRHVKNGASRDPDPSADPKEAILILLVTRETIKNNSTDSYQIVDHPELAGHRAVSGPHVRFNYFHVPSRNLLAAPGQGAALAMPASTESGVLLGAMSVGIMRAAFEAALKFAKEDVRGGSMPLIGRHSVADLLIKIKMNCDASRALTWAAANALMNDFGPELAHEAKIFCSENAVKCVSDAMSVVGV